MSSQEEEIFRLPIVTGKGSEQYIGYVPHTADLNLLDNQGSPVPGAWAPAGSLSPLPPPNAEWTSASPTPSRLFSRAQTGSPDFPPVDQDFSLSLFSPSSPPDAPLHFMESPFQDGSLFAQFLPQTAQGSPSLPQDRESYAQLPPFQAGAPYPAPPPPPGRTSYPAPPPPLWSTPYPAPPPPPGRTPYPAPPPPPGHTPYPAPSPPPGHTPYPSLPPQYNQAAYAQLNPLPTQAPYPPLPPRPNQVPYTQVPPLPAQAPHAQAQPVPTMQSESREDLRQKLQQRKEQKAIEDANPKSPEPEYRSQFKVGDIVRRKEGRGHKTHLFVVTKVKPDKNKITVKRIDTSGHLRGPYEVKGNMDEYVLATPSPNPEETQGSQYMQSSAYGYGMVYPTSAGWNSYVPVW